LLQAQLVPPSKRVEGTAGLKLEGLS